MALRYWEYPSSTIRNDNSYHHRKNVILKSCDQNVHKYHKYVVSKIYEVTPRYYLIPTENNNYCVI